MEIANDKRFLVKDLKSVVVAFWVVMREEGGGRGWSVSQGLAS